MLVLEYMRRIEIAFWTALVALMRNLWVVRIVLITSFIILFSVGLLGIARLALDQDQGGGANQFTISINQTQNDVEFPTQSQRNLLIVLVDSLTASDPRLDGVWLVGWLPSEPHLVFFPIFPSTNKDELDQWFEVFSLDENGQPSAPFLDLLRAQDTWWDYYLTVDHTSLAELIELTGRMDWNGQQLSGGDVLAKLPLARLSPDAALNAQAYIARRLCQNTAATLQTADPVILWGLLTHRMRSNLELANIQFARDDLSFREGGLSCEFPTFQEISLLTGAH